MRETLIQGHIKIQEVWMAEGKSSARAGDILRIARERNIPVRFKKNAELTQILPDVAHQGIIGFAGRFAYSDFERMIEFSLRNEDQALLIAADHITDEGNLGALIRTGAFFGANGLIFPKKRSARVSANVLKRSSGAYVYLPIARVVNMVRALDHLKRKGFWIIGTSSESPASIYSFDWRRDLVLVFGSEQRGLSRSVRERCDMMVSIPSSGYLDSLNVGVAAGVVLSEIFRQRNLQGP